MDYFEAALDFTLAYEGGYDNDPNDRGGETFMGISRKSWPAWVGWTFIDQARAASLDTFEADLMKSPDMQHQVRLFYRANFWDAVHGDELPGKVALALFDAAVHSGARTAIKMLQVALNQTVDGDLGPATVKAAFDAGENGLVTFLAGRCKYLHDIMDKDPSQNVFALNWFRRLFKLANVVLEGPGLELPG